MEATHPRQWVGFYCDGTNDMTFVVQCSNDFIPYGRQQYHLSLSLMVDCFTVWTHLRCLNEGRHPNGNFTDFFHHVKTTYTARGPKKERKKTEVTFLYGKEATLSWDPYWWRGVEGCRFLNYTTKFGRVLAINKILGMTRVVDKWQGHLLGNCKFYWSQVWDVAHSNKEVVCMWFILHKAFAVNEWRACIALASIFRQCVFLIP